MKLPAWLRRCTCRYDRYIGRVWDKWCPRHGELG